MKSIQLIILSAITVIGFATLQGCKPDANTCDNCENELITTLNVELTDSATGIISHFIFRDLDGDGANAPVQFDTIKLLANHTYYSRLLVLDESKTPADTTSIEIANEANDHQFFYHAHTITVDFTYGDYDSHTPPLPVGLQTTWHVGATTGNGQVHIVLRHQPGVKNGTEAPGDTDLDVEFDAVVQ